jgi:hypothetical protein
MPPKKRTIGSTPAERAKERERKRKDAADAAEKQAMASAIEEQRLAAEKEEKEFRKRIQPYPYDVRVEAAAQVALSANNKFTQAQLADRHVVGQTSLKKKIKVLKKNADKAHQDAMIAGVAAAGALLRGSTLNVEADNEAHLTYLNTRSQVASRVHETKNKVADLKASQPSAKAAKRQVRFCLSFMFQIFILFAAKRKRQGDSICGERTEICSKTIALPRRRIFCSDVWCPSKSFTAWSTSRVRRADHRGSHSALQQHTNQHQERSQSGCTCPDVAEV